MERYLLFDSSCIVCSRLARDTENISAGWLHAQSLRDPQIQELLNQGRPGWRWEPMLVEVQDTKVRVFTGAALRFKLVRGLGPRRALRIAQIVGRATTSSRAEQGTGRRTFFKQGAAFLSGAVLLAGLKRFALDSSNSTTSQSQPYATHLATGDPIIEQLKQSYVGRTAAQRFGDLDWNHAYKVTNSSSQLLGYLLLFAPTVGSQTLQFLAVSDMNSTIEFRTLVCQMTWPSRQEQMIHYRTIDNHFLTTHTATWQNGHATFTVSHLPPKTGLAEEAPNVNKTCFLGCLDGCGRDFFASWNDCVNNCLQCGIDGASGTFGWPWLDGNCVQCGLCAGAQAVGCTIGCYDFCK